MANTIWKFAYGEATKEWKACHMRYEEYREELGNQIELVMGFQDLRSKLGEWEEDKVWKGRDKRVSRRERDIKLPKSQEENVNGPEIRRWVYGDFDIRKRFAEWQII